MTAIETLRRPLSLPTETLPNRLAKAALSEGLADALGRPTDRLVRLYQAWARSGAGLLVTGNVSVDRAHVERPGDVVLDAPPDDEMRAALAAWARAARAQGAGAWMQLSHAGRQTFRTVNPSPRAPSPIPMNMPGKNFGAPLAMSEDEILTVASRFGAAAAYAREAGFTGVEILAGHGFLVSQFLSPLANRRKDAWGGPLENRARFLVEIVRRTRRTVGRDFTLAVRLNSADFRSGGFEAGECLLVAGWLLAEGVDVLDISGGTYERPRMDGVGAPMGPPYFVAFAKELARSVALPLLVAGGFRRAEVMAEAIDDGIALIGLGRPFCVDPIVAAKVFSGHAVLDRPEEALRLGPGLLDRTSALDVVRVLNQFGARAWHRQQLRRLADGLQPDLSLTVMTALKAERAAESKI